MKNIYQRIVAIFIMCIPGVIAIYGWTLIRDTLFNYFGGQGMAWLPFLAGIFLLLFGLTFIGGFIFYRDKKRNKIQPMLLSKEERAQLDPTIKRKRGV